MPAARTGAAKRYAEAVFDIAKDENSFDRWSADLGSIARMQEDPLTGKVLGSPAVDMPAKERIVAEYLAGGSDKARNLVRLLLHKGRLSLAPQIVEHYQELVNRYRGIATAEVTSAVPLNPEELEMIAGRLSSLTGRRVTVRAAVDPSIMGGIVARVGDQLIDASVRGRLEALKKRLAST